MPGVLDLYACIRKGLDASLQRLETSR